MNLGLEGRVVLISGSSKGIGRAIAKSFLEEGARVTVTGRNERDVKATASAFATDFDSDRLLTFVGDLTQRQTVQEWVEQAHTRFGHLDHLVANLGKSSGKVGAEAEEDEWRELWDANFFGAVSLVQAALPKMSSGSITFINSICGVESSAAPLGYSAAKAALLNYSKNLALQLGPKGIRVNTIAPGHVFFEGGVWDRKIQERGGESYRKEIEANIPLGRFGRPEDIAQFAVFLASERASYLHGASLVVDGGLTKSV